MTPIRPRHYIVTRYWLKYFVNNGLCALCGNSGTIDTRERAVSATGIDVGIKTYCICPNGQALRSSREREERP